MALVKEKLFRQTAAGREDFIQGMMGKVFEKQLDEWLESVRQDAING
jgi:hypothetical protein